MIDDGAYQNLFQNIGQEWETELVIDFKQIEKFVCSLYGKNDLDSVNDARYDIFKFSYKTGTTLPPNLDSLICHTRRANYQAAIHRRCLQRMINAPSPTAYGWKTTDNLLVTEWNTQPIAPDSLLKQIACGCKKTSCEEGNKCSCRSNGLKCTELCKCLNCCNVQETNEVEDLDSEDEDDQDSDAE